MLVDLAILLVLVLLNGFLALSELAVLSSRRSRLRALADGGSHGARVALALAEQPGHFLSAVQVGITLIGLIAGAYSGASLAEPLAIRLEGLGVADHLSDFLAFAIVMTGVTYLSLVIGELVPKQVALHHPERMAAAVAPAMWLLTRAAWPLVVGLEASSRVVLGLFGLRPGSRPNVTREEIRALIAEGERAGVVPPQARSMMAGVIRLHERSVGAIMTPGTEVDWIDLDEDAAALRARLKGSRHTRLPVAKGSLDHVVGVIRPKELLDAYLANEPPDPRAFVREVPAVIDASTAFHAMETLRASRVHMVLVVDEYGGFKGLVTTTNILEAIAGTFPVGGEEPGPAAVQRDDGSWLLDGDLPVDRMAEELGLVLPSAREYHTVAGFVLATARHIPAVGEAVTHRGWRFEVVDMDGRRIDKVLAARLGDRRLAG